ncbi:putative EamA family transporter [Paratrimastix pyriformis]|uniref:EamA family transporter n=1 Tax=Paratrimastix pyriformis TaxID=342808 RepID=A0ABQ8UUF6_9EUKA|nr:putative EamA family transporter [Paratrimastix pyriformis]
MPRSFFSDCDEDTHQPVSNAEPSACDKSLAVIHERTPPCAGGGNVGFELGFRRATDGLTLRRRDMHTPGKGHSIFGRHFSFITMPNLASLKETYSKLVINKHFNTALGCLAVVLWSTSFAVSRSIAENLGVYFGGFLRNLLGSGIGLAVGYKKLYVLKTLWKEKKPFLFVCGSNFTLSYIALNIAVGWCINREQTISISTINCVWITCVGGSMGVDQFFYELVNNPGAYFMAVVAAVTWPIYSNYNRRWTGAFRGQPEVKDADITVSVFLFATAVALGIGSIFEFAGGLKLVWSVRGVLELLYNGIFPTYIASLVWDAAMRRGSVVFVSAFSFLAPLIAALTSSLYLGVPFTVSFFIGAVLVMAGGLLSRFGVKEEDSSAKAAPAAPTGSVALPEATPQEIRPILRAEEGMTPSASPDALPTPGRYGTATSEEGLPSGTPAYKAVPDVVFQDHPAPEMPSPPPLKMPTTA